MTFSPRAIEAAARAIAVTRGAIWTRPDHTVSANFDHDAAVAALSAALAVDGVALVPVEPTEDMLDFGACYEDPDGLYQNHSIFKDGDISRDVYRAMVEAASREFLPQPPAASDGEVG